MLLGVSKTLRQRLLDAAPGIGSSGVEISNLQSDKPDGASADKLILFLYAVSENRHLHNLPPDQLPDGRYRQAPLALTLHYLITYNSPDAEQGQPRLALVLRAFHSRARLGPSDLHQDIQNDVEGLTIRLRAMGSEELNQVWTALNVGMRPALFYDVDLALLEPFADVPLTPPVSDREARYLQGVES
ncbi:MAG TPA: DUF4255 domain-containing protein [Thermoleophilaceae bacterium]|nr:DUF4255 domain-containing protein [Thermoleophilaceae bacterium]